MLLESIPFVLGGWLNPERSFGVDGWISDGSVTGGVRLDFDDGWWASRERDNRLSKEKEQVATSSGSKGDEAEREIVERLGLTVDDLFAARFLRQRQAARFVLARPEERMQVVGDWLRLGPLESAEKSSGKDSASLEKEVERAQRALEVAEGVGKSVGDVVILAEELRQVAEALEDAKDSAVAAKAIAEDAEEERRTAIRAQASAERYAVVVEEGKRLAEELRGVDGEVLTAELSLMVGVLDRRKQARTDAARDEAKWMTLAGGFFDGNCPVACIKCPAQDRINSDGEKNRRLYEAAKGERVRKEVELRDQEGEVRVQSAIINRTALAENHLNSLREEATRLKPLAERGSPSAEEVASWENSIQEASRTREEVRRLEGEVSRLGASLRAAQEAGARVSGAREELARAEGKAQVAREGAALFRSARRKIAEAALSTIERDANVALSRMSEGLSFELSWSRPGGSLAKTCGECGEPFPRGERAKSCARCSAVRGPSMVEKLEVVMSAQSGALEDLAGVFLSLAAAKWLSVDRGSPFSSVFLDECTAHLDRAHRATFARKLPAILGSMGATQGFIVSHDSATIASLPAKILVESDGKRSTVRVAE
jgi:DNA repair exonuclease SbcCD ATPase subunit